MARTYAETPNSTSEVHGSDIIVVQQGNGVGAAGFPQMKKTNLETLKEYMTDGIASAIVFKGSLTWSQLQALTGMKVGDMYNVTDRDGQNYAWTGIQWDALGETKDLSGIEERLAAEEEATGRLTSRLTELSNDTYRKAEVDSKVAEATPADYEALKQSVKVQSWEIDNLKAMAEGKIARTSTETITDNPKTMAYPRLAPWARLMRQRMKSVVWNQLIANPVYTVEGVWSYVEVGNFYTVSDHIYFYSIYTERKSGYIRTTAEGDAPYITKDEVTRGVERVIKGTGKATRVLMHSDGNSSPDTVHTAWVDMTTLFNVTETNQVTEAMKTFVRQYAEAHPEYDAGSILDLVPSKVFSHGKNWLDSVIDGFPNTNGSGINSANGTKTAFAKVDGKGGKFTLSCSRNCNRLMYGVSHSTSIVANNYIYVQTSDISGLSRVLDIPSGWEYVFVYLGNDFSDSNFTVQFEIGEQATSYVPHMESLTILPTIEGYEGTEVDYEKETVEWKWGKIRLRSLLWIRYKFGDVYAFYANISSKKSGYSLGICDRYAWAPRSASALENLEMNIATNQTYIYIRDDSCSSVTEFENLIEREGVELVYELAEPIVKTFAELGITKPDDIKVEENGTITILNNEDIAIPTDYDLRIVADLT